MLLKHIGMVDVKLAKESIVQLGDKGVQGSWELLPFKLQISSSDIFICSILIVWVRTSVSG